VRYDGALRRHARDDIEQRQACKLSFSDEKSSGNFTLLDGGSTARLSRQAPFATSVPFDVETGTGYLHVRLRLVGNFCRRCAVGAAQPEWDAWSDYAGLEQEDLRGVAGGWGLCADGTMFSHGVKEASPVGDFRGKELSVNMNWDLGTMTVTVLGEAPVTWTGLPRDAVPGVTIGGRRGRAIILSGECVRTRATILRQES
jgi:hypothetical protein